MSNILKKIKQLSANSFTKDNYENYWWSFLDVDFIDSIDINIIKKCIKKYAVGYCDGCKLTINPSPNIYVIMFEKDKFKFWTQIDKRFIETNIQIKKEDLIGKKYGRLTVLERAEDYISPSGQSFKKLKCSCDCGNEKTVMKGSLTRGLVKSCGCLQSEKAYENLTNYIIKKRLEQPNDLIGKKFGKLTVISRITLFTWECICECGNKATVTGENLISSTVKDCGCTMIKTEIKFSKLDKNWVVRIKHNNITYKIPQIETLEKSEEIISDIKQHDLDFANWFNNNEEYKKYIKLHESAREERRIKQNRQHAIKVLDSGYFVQWRLNNKDKVREYYINREHKKHEIKKSEWEDCKKYFDYTCAYCGLPINEHYQRKNGQLANIDFHRDHFDNNGLNDLSNCVPACRICNVLKSVKPIFDWYNTDNKNYNEIRYEKIMKWINEDYKKYIKRRKK